MVGSFTSLVNFYSMIAWSFYLLAVLALLILRRREPHAERPYRVWIGVPVVFCAVTVFLITFSVKEAPKAAAGAALFMLSGVPLWWTVVVKEVKWEGMISSPFFLLGSIGAFVELFFISSGRKCLQNDWPGICRVMCYDMSWMFSGTAVYDTVEGVEWVGSCHEVVEIQRL